jgi:hypothetical protein
VVVLRPFLPLPAVVVPDCGVGDIGVGGLVGVVQVLKCSLGRQESVDDDRLSLLHCNREKEKKVSQ